jgi:hypothetical protein
MYLSNIFSPSFGTGLFGGDMDTIYAVLIATLLTFSHSLYAEYRVYDPVHCKTFNQVCEAQYLVVTTDSDGTDFKEYTVTKEQAQELLDDFICNKPKWTCKLVPLRR